MGLWVLGAWLLLCLLCELVLLMVGLGDLLLVGVGLGFGCFGCWWVMWLIVSTVALC